MIGRLHKVGLGLTVVLSLAAPGAWAGWEHLRVTRCAKRLNQARGERDRLALQSPPPTAETEAAYGARMDRLSRQLSDWIQRWKPRKSGTAGSPAPVDAMVATAQFVREGRVIAQRAGLKLRPEEGFGYESYAKKVPEPSALSRLSADRASAASILRLVIEAHPDELVAFRREHAVGAGSDSTASATETFALPSALSLRQAGWAESSAHAVEFVGTTASLRRLLKAVVLAPGPLAVRSVTVQPVAPILPATNRSGLAGPNPDPDRVRARFTVVVEELRFTASRRVVSP